jgi:phosphopantothenoylcysteine decarboxylase / phosphopantothenate---cysteine ligase
MIKPDSNLPHVAPIRMLITAGPTHEPIDAVRYIANRSSGQMGLSLAAASVKRGWPTTLLLGPTHLTPPDHSNLRCERFRTTADLQRLLTQEFPKCNALIMAAAVADFRPAGVSDTKLSRTDAGLTLQLEPTSDLLAIIADSASTSQTIIGFALEPEDRLLNSARSKLTRKKADLIIANPLETMDSPIVSATIVDVSGRTETAPPAMPKSQFAEWLLTRVESMIRTKMGKCASESERLNRPSL